MTARIPICLGIAVLALFGASGTAAAQSPTPTPESEPPPTTFQLGFEAPLTYTWPPVTAATDLQITGTVLALRVNALDPFCTPPLEADTRTVSIDEELPGDATSYTIPLPVLPPSDTWLVAQDSILLDAFDGETLVAQGQRGIIVETLCLRPTPTATPLAEDLVIGGCRIPASFRETTTQAARDRGQRVFVDPGGGQAIYVRSDGSCVSLAAIPPLPEYAPEGSLGEDGVASDRALTSLPGTGSGRGAGERAAGIATVALALILAGLLTLGAGVRHL